jgi:hypothetical protein
MTTENKDQEKKMSEEITVMMKETIKNKSFIVKCDNCQKVMVKISDYKESDLQRSVPSYKFEYICIQCDNSITISILF